MSRGGCSREIELESKLPIEMKSAASIPTRFWSPRHMRKQRDISIGSFDSSSISREHPPRDMSSSETGH
eukprot:gene26024-biopygen13056